ncbi:F-box protein CPR1-like [Ipomoea triloba]|uniref:F-box protein CPR1-like n=1 Tax=Ipomoea triloba TaxID=35885 RepID=UPI00125E9556|nr:F-box protein CPR1-like [Ipomoea triloba]
MAFDNRRSRLHEYASESNHPNQLRSEVYSLLIESLLARTSMRLKRRIQPYIRRLTGSILGILGSCHWLLCLDNGDEDSIVLWNPTTWKYLISPLSGSKISRDQNVLYGFGYDNVSDDYKVLRIAESYDCESEVKVFSVKSNSWRKIHCFPHYLKYERAHGVQATGALHWV